jgi:hypothetical protein
VRRDTDPIHEKRDVSHRREETDRETDSTGEDILIPQERGD